MLANNRCSLTLLTHFERYSPEKHLRQLSTHFLVTDNDFSTHYLVIDNDFCQIFKYLNTHFLVIDNNFSTHSLVIDNDFVRYSNT